MDQILHSNKSSVILRSLPAQSVENLSYGFSASFPILAKNYRELPSDNTISGSPEGQDVTFKLNKAFLLRNMQIRTAYTTTTTGMAATQPVGLQMFEWIELRSNNTVLCRLSDAYIQARVRQGRCDEAVAMYSRALPLLPTTELLAATTDASCVTYTPIFNEFFESFRNHLDLSFVEQIQIVARFNTAARAGFNQALSGATCTLWNWTYDIDPKAKDVLLAQNYLPRTPLSMYSYSTATEKVVCSGTTTNTYRLSTNFPVTTTYVMLRDNTAAGLGAYRRIDKMTFSIQGNALLENVPRNVVNYESELLGTGTIIPGTLSTVVREPPKFLVIHWNMDPKDHTYNSGGLSMSTINYASITITHETVTAANTDFIVVHEYAQLLSIDSENGMCTVSQNQ